MTILGVLPVEDAPFTLADRIHEATLRCVARWGVAKTTLDDIAREAGCSRATIYRTFAGGKQALVASLAIREAKRLGDRVVAGLDHVATLEELAVTVVARASRCLAGHAAFRFLLAHEPDLVLPLFAFGRFDETLREAGAVAAPALTRFMGAPAAGVAAEWLARVVVSHALCRSESFDLGDEADARRFVRCFVLPGLEMLADEASVVVAGPRHDGASLRRVRR